MATPIAYSLTLLDISSSTHNAQQAEHEQQQQQQQLSSEKQQRRRSMDWETHYRQQRTQAGAALQYSGTGFAHMEKNWGDAFPEQWVWAQGVSRDGKVSDLLAECVGWLDRHRIEPCGRQPWQNIARFCAIPCVLLALLMYTALHTSRSRRLCATLSYAIGR